MAEIYKLVRLLYVHLYHKPGSLLYESLLRRTLVLSVHYASSVQLLVNNMSKSVQITETLIESKIYLLRGQKVMLDFDLAEMYAVLNKALKQAIKRNIDRFPEDFMFELREDEVCSLKVTNCDLKQRR